MDTLPLRRVAEITLGRMRDPASDDGPFQVAYLRAANVADGRLRLDDVKSMHFSVREQARYALRDGDVLVTEASGSRHQVGQTALVDSSVAGLMFQNTLLRLRPLAGLDGRYLYWWSRHAYASGLYAQAAQGLGIWHLGAERLGTIAVPIPPLPQQRRIADFLDEQIKILERTSEAETRRIELLDEGPDALIGLRLKILEPSSPHHELSPIKRSLRKLSRPALEAESRVVTVFRDGQVTARALRRQEGYTESSTGISMMQGVKVGDVVVHGLDGFSGAIGTSESAGVCSPANHVCEPLRDGDPDYYGRLLRILALSGYLSLFGGSSRERAVDYRNWATFSSIPIPVTPLAEQRAIGERIRSNRPLSVVINRLRALLAERKQALITAAVTGQFDVTTARSLA